MPQPDRLDLPEKPDAGVTAQLSAWCAGFRNEMLTARALDWARHALLDWAAVTVAGAREPLVEMLAQDYAGTDGGPCTLIALGRRAGAIDAALINGAAGHALDFDDVNPRMNGHPTVPVAPVALALAETTRASGLDVLRAIVAGHEVECRLGEMLTRSHYDKGFHATGTVGTFGAAAAAANLLGLDAERTAHAFGLAATQAAGLKCMFGTMAKPLHAGKAAMNGLMAAQLAARGFTAAPDAIECAQGFADTQAPDFAPCPVRPDPDAAFAIEGTLFKYHASCYLTHSAIEAIRMLRAEHGAGLSDLASMTVYATPGHRTVCDIAEPRTGLSVKFSIRHLAALALDGADTADLGLYTDAVAEDARLGEARRKIALDVARPLPHRMAAVVALETLDGRTLLAEANVGLPLPDISGQWSRLTAKARAICTPVIGEVRTARMIEAIARLDKAASAAALLEAIA